MFPSVPVSAFRAKNAATDRPLFYVFFVRGEHPRAEIRTGRRAQRLAAYMYDYGHVYSRGERWDIWGAYSTPTEAVEAVHDECGWPSRTEYHKRRVLAAVIY